MWIEAVVLYLIVGYGVAMMILHVWLKDSNTGRTKVDALIYNVVWPFALIIIFCTAIFLLLTNLSGLNRRVSNSIKKLYSLDD